MYCEPLTCKDINKELIKSFYIEREKEYSNPMNTGGRVIGLEAYLKYSAWDDDLNGEIKAYVVKTYFSNEIVAYFALKTSAMIIDSKISNAQGDKTYKHGKKLVSEIIPCVEISHFAVNDRFREKHNVKTLGNIIYPEFIYPIIDKFSKIVGVRCILLYAAGDEHLVNYYEKVFGFETTQDTEVVPVMPYYDIGCVPMYYML